MKTFEYDSKSISMWMGSTFMNIFGTISRNDVTFALGLISTSLVIVYHLVKIRNEIKNKK